MAISEQEYHALVSRRKPRHEVDTTLWMRAHLAPPEDGKVAAYSFEYEDLVLTVRAPYRAAVDAAVRYFRQENTSEVAVNYIRLLPSKFKHGDEAKVTRI
jgi:hypothetical protein